MQLNQKMGYGKYVPPMNYGGVNEYLEGAFDDKRPHSEKIIACHGIGSEPEDVANAFLYLASDLASYVTGEILSVDGAMRS